MGIEIFGKITAYPIEANHDDCAVAFTGGYEKIKNKEFNQKINFD